MIMFYKAKKYSMTCLGVEGDKFKKNICKAKLYSFYKNGKDFVVINGRIKIIKRGKKQWIRTQLLQLLLYLLY